MRFDDELSFQEIASIRDITASAARVRYVRALDRFGVLWQQLYPEM
jgi:hypothetical protein